VAVLTENSLSLWSSATLPVLRSVLQSQYFGDNKSPRCSSMA